MLALCDNFHVETNNAHLCVTRLQIVGVVVVANKYILSKLMHWSVHSFFIFYFLFSFCRNVTVTVPFNGNSHTSQCTNARAIWYDLTAKQINDYRTQIYWKLNEYNEWKKYSKWLIAGFWFHFEFGFFFKYLKRNKENFYENLLYRTLLLSHFHSHFSIFEMDYFVN